MTTEHFHYSRDSVRTKLTDGCESTGVFSSLTDVGDIGEIVLTLSPSRLRGVGAVVVVGVGAVVEGVAGTLSKISGTGGLLSSGEGKGDVRTGLKVLNNSGPQMSS